MPNLFNSFSNLFSNSYSDLLSKLLILKLNDNNLTRLNQNTFSGLTNLKTLMLSKNSINIIEKGAFYGLSNLETLNLSYNRIDNIEEEAFNGLDNLNTLDLGSNNLKKLSRNIFNKLGNLNYLTLFNNRINMIEEGAFNGLGNLNELCLMSNLLEVLKRDTFNTLNNLRILNLSNVKMNTIEQGAFNGLNILQKINLSDNYITTLNINIFNRLYYLKHLEVFNLNHTNIEILNINTFNGLYNLEKLYLGYIRIEPEAFNNKIESGLFNKLSNLKELILKTNNIPEIKYKLFIGLISISSITIHNITISNDSCIYYYNRIYNLYKNIITLDSNEKLLNKNNTIKPFLDLLKILIVKLSDEVVISNREPYNRAIRGIKNFKELLKTILNNNFKENNNTNNNKNLKLKLQFKNNSSFKKNNSETINLKNSILKKSEYLIHMASKNNTPKESINLNTIPILNLPYSKKSMNLIIDYDKANNKNIYLNELSDPNKLIELYSIVNFLDIKKIENKLFLYILDKIMFYNQEELISFFNLKKKN